ncbi:hypothetical protein Hanom_Chr05g00454541 [Helianthus anomalus]
MIGYNLSQKDLQLSAYIRQIDWYFCCGNATYIQSLAKTPLVLQSSILDQNQDNNLKQEAASFPREKKIQSTRDISKYIVNVWCSLTTR